MLTGQRAFAGEDVSDTLANVLKMEPAWERLPAEVPARIRQVLRACLQKNAKQRIGDVQDVRLALEGAFETAVSWDGRSGTRDPAAPTLERALPVVAAAVAASALVGAAAWTLKPTPPSPVTRFALALGEGQQIQGVNNQSVAVSPDGTQLVYVANNQLYLRSMSDLEARPIPGNNATDAESVHPAVFTRRPVHRLSFSHGESD